MNFDVENVSENTKIELPYIYYLGYSAKLEKEDGSEQTLEISESDNGFCEVVLSNIEKGKITISYTGTVLMKISYITTIFGFIGILWIKLKKVT